MKTLIEIEKWTSRMDVEAVIVMVSIALLVAILAFVIGFSPIN